MRLGEKATWNGISSRYYLRGGSKWVKDKISDCLVCAQKRKIQFKHERAPLKPIPVTPKIMWRVHVDLAGPFPESRNGNRHVAIA